MGMPGGGIDLIISRYEVLMWSGTGMNRRVCCALGMGASSAAISVAIGVVATIKSGKVRMTGARRASPRVGAILMSSIVGESGGSNCIISLSDKMKDGVGDSAKTSIGEYVRGGTPSMFIDNTTFAKSRV